MTRRPLMLQSLRAAPALKPPADALAWHYQPDGGRWIDEPTTLWDLIRDGADLCVTNRGRAALTGTDDTPTSGRFRRA